MKTNIGGDRLGSGNKQEVSGKTFNRSTHDLSSLWRSSMSAGTLVPFLNELALPGDIFDIDLNCEVVTLPTIGPLFGSYKVQLDVFQVPMRIYNSQLHMNRLGIGNKMGEILIPQYTVLANKNHLYADNAQISPSSILKYLGISGIGQIGGNNWEGNRNFNAIPLLGYWSIFKNYYANKQEEDAYVIHTSEDYGIQIQSGFLSDGSGDIGDITLGTELFATEGTGIQLIVAFEFTDLIPNAGSIILEIDSVETPLNSAFNSVVWDDELNSYICTEFNGGASSSVGFQLDTANLIPAEGELGAQIQLKGFPLENIDLMQDKILQHDWNEGAFIIKERDERHEPYTLPQTNLGDYSNQNSNWSYQYGQEGLAVKTYQSDLFNNWISTEWIDGADGINEITKISTEGDSFSIDSLNLARKVYLMLNRIAVSGGSYDDWLDAVYTHERSKSMDSPMYLGSLIKELAFEEVISNSAEGDEPLGTLAGRGRLTQKNKGGKIHVKVDEPSYLIGIVSLTPRVSYSQGNKWHMNLKSFDDLHKPQLDGIGFQDLITDQMVWSDTEMQMSGYDAEYTFKSAGKQPAWLNYMTNIDEIFGNFADTDKEGYMVLNRNYDKDSKGDIQDLTTYIDPSKFNNIFAQTSLDSQNFWVHISKKITARRKMSAKIIPNL